MMTMSGYVGPNHHKLAKHSFNIHHGNRYILNVNQNSLKVENVLLDILRSTQLYLGKFAIYWNICGIE